MVLDAAGADLAAACSAELVALAALIDVADHCLLVDAEFLDVDFYHFTNYSR